MITAREFLDQAWQREDKILLSPNLTRIIERFNQVPRRSSSSSSSTTTTTTTTTTTGMNSLTTL
jgi:hypothetical protein